MAGLLDFDAMDPAQYQVSDDERKRIIFQNLMFQLAPALAGSRKGELLQGAAFGLTNGAMAAQQGLAGAQQGKYDKLRMASGLMDYQTKKRGYDDDTRAREVEQGFQMPPPMADMSPTPANAAALSAAPKAGTYEQLMAKAQAFEDAKLPKKAAEYRAEAQKHRPKYSTTPHNVKGPDGRVQLAQFSEYDAPKILEGMSPAEKLHFGSTGGMTNVGFDTFTGAPVSQGLPATMDPAQQDASKRGWASQDLERQKFGYQQQRDRAADAKPPAEAKPERPTDQQLATGSFLDRMQSASKILNEVEKKYTPGFDQTSVNVMKGLPLIGGAAGYLAESTRNAAGPNAAIFNNAQDAWIRAKLRKESGAVIGTDEMEAERRTFFPQPNDPPELVKQKRQLRLEVERSMEKQARGGFQGGNSGAADPLGIR
jgi:hypothetical protein